MPDKKDLKYLLQLIDDPTPEIRDHILDALENYGLDLESDIAEYRHIMSIESYSVINFIIEKNRRLWLQYNWYRWQEKDGEKEQLEEAMELISRFLSGLSTEKTVTDVLDDLASGFLRRYPEGSEIDLSNYLFVEKGIAGAKEDYFNPLNTSIFYAVNKKQGLPITLSVLYILVGHRLGFSIEGCNFPGHFLAKTFYRFEPVLVDCYNGGKVVRESEIRELAGKDSFDSILQIIDMKAYTSNIVRRLLNNLSNAYRNRDDKANADFFAQMVDNASAM